MIDRRVQMMDAGMMLFQTEKPFGTVLGGIKKEMLRYGKVLRRNEFELSELPESTDDCDLFLDWSCRLRKRYMAVRLEDAGTVGMTDEGEEIHRYAACLKEGNRNTTGRNILAWGQFIALVAVGAMVATPLPRFITIIAGAAVGGFILFKLLEPSKKAQKAVSSLLSIIKDAQ
ncbi:MAG: hypothetical protein KBS78_10070 [Bacteroidales bacterium]|nr:hypothetical protein [Candidatus Cryptobacteroides faecihippi]